VRLPGAAGAATAAAAAAAARRSALNAVAATAKLRGVAHHAPRPRRSIAGALQALHTPAAQVKERATPLSDDRASTQCR
jgi:hypothetical protein